MLTMRPRLSEPSSSTSRIIKDSQASARLSQFNITEDYQPGQSSTPPHASSAPALLERSVLSETSFHMIDTPLPIKNQSMHIFDLAKKMKNTTSASFHKVYKVHKLNKSTDTCYFFKLNKTHSFMSELEATACHFYQYLIPGYVPSAHAHYDEKGLGRPYVGISSKGIPGFKSTMDDPLTKEDLKNKTFVKGLAHCAAASYLFEEDDLHRGNFSKTGHRIDFDMSLWPILCKYKESGYIDWTFRYPNPQTFSIHEEDIRHFPNIKVAKPFYWPTNPAPIIPQSIRVILSQFIPISKNSFGDNEIAIYQLLEHDETFKYETNKVFLKYILTSDTLFRDIAQLHLRSEADHIIKVIGKHEMQRIKKLSDVWRKMPEFKEFILHNGKQALAEIIREQTEWNEKIQGKIAKYHKKIEELKLSSEDQQEIASFARKVVDLKPLIIDTDATRKTFSGFVEEVMRPVKRY